MKWKLMLLPLAFAISGCSLQGEGALSTAAAQKELKTGALLVDVRTPAEFKEKNLAGAVNIPVDTIRTGITNATTDKGRVILLHCRSGRRSAIAEKELRALGYTNAFNIGSYQQAQKVVGEPAQ